MVEMRMQARVENGLSAWGEYSMDLEEHRWS
jgi:hypothetical protein